MKLSFLTIITLFLCGRFAPTSCSIGDNSQVYASCMNKCEKQNCSNNGESFKSGALIKQDYWCELFQWTCREECRYECMWVTVIKFHRAGEETPKFHGRWPFKRLLGMQEPASAFASALNLLANIYMYKQLGELPVTKVYISPFIDVWRGFAVICMNAWGWSTIFHMRDNRLTEFMDYAFALSMVMGLFIVAIVRILYKKSTYLMFFVLAVPSFYYIAHVRYLYSGAINYDYNMKVNVTFGVLGSLLWLGLSWHQWKQGRRYAWRMMAFTLLSGAALSLELLDFPPKMGWDAHALWHLSTAPLPLLFFRYVMDDIRYLGSMDSGKFALKLT